MPGQKAISRFQDIAGTGFDNRVGELFIPPLTTVQLPPAVIGREAALHIIEGRTGGGCKRLHCPLLIRSSA
ncbi:hypothetical protein GCM10009414_12200 [Tatumella terrea]